MGAGADGQQRHGLPRRQRKQKYLRKELDRSQYLDAAVDLTAWFGARERQIKDIELHSPGVIMEVRRIADTYDLDFSDAFQILSIRDGIFSHLTNGSKSILVTADKNLARAAKAEDLRVWFVMDEPPPQ